MAGISQGDKSITTGKAKQVARRTQFRDLDLSLEIHPIRKDLIALVDDNAIKNSVRNILLTNFNERPFNSGSGANLRGRLFEPNDAITRIGLRADIRRSITQGEPRVNVLAVNLQDNPDRNAYNVQVYFLIKEFDTVSNINIELRRLR